MWNLCGQSIDGSQDQENNIEGLEECIVGDEDEATRDDSDPFIA